MIRPTWSIGPLTAMNLFHDTLQDRNMAFLTWRDGWNITVTPTNDHTEKYFHETLPTDPMETDNEKC